MATIVPIILSGGSGTRLWPLSREQYPKQFLELYNNKTLFRNTIERVSGIEGRTAPVVVCSAEHRFYAAAELESEGLREESYVVLEPCARNTCAAVVAGVLQALQAHEDPYVLVLPVDHLIADVDAFAESCQEALSVIGESHFGLFGITPTSAHTGYGYLCGGKGSGTREIERFVEKPSAGAAAELISQQGTYWNSGMFLFKASLLIDVLGELEPEVLRNVRSSFEKRRDDIGFIRLDEESFAASPAGSFDTMVLERVAHSYVVPLTTEWSDIGSWSSLWESMPKDEANNVAVGDVLLHETQDSLVRSESRLVTTLGVKDLVIVETSDAVLVADKAASQEVKKIVTRLRAQDRKEPIHHSTVHRPWGHYQVLILAERFQVKRIMVNQQGRLSLQRHHHRSEHWVVVKGSAEVRVDDTVHLLTEGDSIAIPLGAVHQLFNPGKIPLELIEVQTGSYLGEDDIVRLEDQYGRAPKG